MHGRVGSVCAATMPKSTLSDVKPLPVMVRVPPGCVTDVTLMPVTTGADGRSGAPSRLRYWLFACWAATWAMKSSVVGFV